MIIIKISGIQSSDIVRKYARTYENNAVSTKKKQGADKVNLTEDSKTFSVAFKEAKKAMAASNENNAEKISGIKAQIEQGTYSVSGYEVAKKIMFDL